jgi:hypothetical protein
MAGPLAGMPGAGWTEAMATPGKRGSGRSTIHLSYCLFLRPKTCTAAVVGKQASSDRTWRSIGADETLCAQSISGEVRYDRGGKSGWLRRGRRGESRVTARSSGSAAGYRRWAVMDFDVCDALMDDFPEGPNFTSGRRSVTVAE